MFIKSMHWLGIIACIVLIISCFLPWVYYADINQTFTGFYSYQNEYGKPGKFLTFLAGLMIAFIVTPKIWAKRANLFIGAFTIAYAVKTFILFGSCYNNYCPQKLFSLYLMLSCAVAMLISAVFPKLNINRTA